MKCGVHVKGARRWRQSVSACTTSTTTPAIFLFALQMAMAPFRPHFTFQRLPPPHALERRAFLFYTLLPVACEHETSMSIISITLPQRAAAARAAFVKHNSGHRRRRRRRSFVRCAPDQPHTRSIRKSLNLNELLAAGAFEHKRVWKVAIQVESCSACTTWIEICSPHLKKRLFDIYNLFGIHFGK